MIEIDDQAYKFFVEEATELLQTLEQGLINISQEHEIQKLHQLMRAAHSIKGGAACIGLMGIQTIAHDLENSIRALYQENTVFDLELENLLLQAFDCLRSPTVKQIETGNYDQENSIIKAKQVFEQIEKKLGHSLEEAAEFPEVSMEEGDMTKFLFTEEIPSGLHRWENLLAGNNGPDSGLSIQDELKRQAEVFATLGTMLNLPGFTSIAQTTIKALEVNPKYIKKIATLALADFWAGQKAVLAGDRTQGGNLNATLVKLTKPLKSRKVETTAKRKQVNQPTQAVKAVVPQKSEVAVETENVKTSNSATASVNISQKQVSAPGVANQKKQIQQKQITSTSSSSLGVRIDINRLEMLNNLLGELATQDNSFILQNQQSQASIGTLEKGWQKFHQLMMKLQDINTFPEQLKKSPNSQNNQLAYLVNILPNLLEEIAQVGEAVNDIKLLHQQSQQVVKKRQQTLQQIQNHLTKTRMLPVESLLNRFPRMIRDLSVQKQKQVKLELVGMNTLIDKAVLEKLYDPIVHIVRNAFDHGIEPPEIRQSNGKSKEGKITIKSYYQGNYTYIEIRDDGRGIDVNKIRNLAIKKKIFSVTEAAKLSTKQLYKLLFYPNFSTTKKVSDLSGRGMGLESVYSQIESLKGNITIQSQLGQGTKFLLRLPWTLTITKLLVFRMEGNLFAIPLDILAAIIYVDPSEIKVERREKVYYWKGKKVSIAPSILFNCNYPIAPGIIQQEPIESSWKNSYTKNSQGKVMLLLISEDSDTIAIKIEQILMEQNLTIKPFSNILTAPSYLYGCAILGDGSLVPVIDGIKLLEKTLQTEQFNTKKSSKNTSKFKQYTLSKLPTILVIDDSLTTRQAISSTLQKAGYDIVQAKDGWQGLVQLQQHTQIQAVICDVEMPEMNGFEFLSRCRKQYSMAEMPVLMLTSRSSQPYRILAKQLGANDYLSKPYLDQELINSLQKYLQV
ncbi:MAG: hybrid sensor histidine kinase/response regulator [Okeania sp. SIO2C9]|uniref:hybrid sensor histidine kinase/response regulator n=1 Tax=Okeania sp. SIO2C9 TaxID=2607791 RepID=UPI0013BEDCAE|nr:response regulator [Okeania sp. SIO2C9]NEQ76417.1 hybrid sensor histidine kinase/response regulator [Okeania sp. SIO2C9]